MSGLLGCVGEIWPEAGITVHSYDPGSYPTGVPFKVRHSLYTWAVFEDPRWFVRVRRMCELGLALLFGGAAYLPSRELKALAADYRSADLALFAGGGYLRSRHGVRQSLNLIMQLWMFWFAKRCKLPAVVSPVSFGPFAYRWQGWLVAKTLRYCDVVTVREDLSLKRLHASGVRHALYASDSALFLKQVTVPEPRPFTVGFTVRSWKGVPDRQLVEAYVGALAQLAEAFEYSVKPFVQVDGPAYGESDVSITAQVVSGLVDRGVKVLPTVHVGTVEQYLGEVGACRLFLGMRMHSNIMAAVQEVPFVAVSYEYKTEGISKNLRHLEYCVPCSEATADRLADLLVRLHGHYAEERGKLAYMVRKNERKNRTFFLEILRHAVPRSVEQGDWRRVFRQNPFPFGPREIFFEVDASHSGMVAEDMSPFLPAFLLAAMSKGHDLHLAGPVSTRLLGGAAGAAEVLGGWNIGLSRIKVASDRSEPDSYGASGVGLFFSGGVDSFYTYLKHREGGPGERPTHLIFVHGFDVPLRNVGLFTEIARRLKAIATAEGVELVLVRTNVREFLDLCVPWDYSHGAAMAGVALCLRWGLRRIYFAGAMPKAHLKPNGIRPDLDFHWSTETLEVVHDGDEVDRLHKVVNVIAKSDLALRHLRVCWKNRAGDYNCCECEKCMRTMLNLEAAGVLSQCPTFPKPINLKLLRNLYLFPNQVRYFRESMEEMERRGGPAPVIEAVRECLRRNARRGGLSRSLYRIRHTAGELDGKYFGGAVYKALSRYGILK